MYQRGKRKLQELEAVVNALRDEARTGLASDEVRRFAIKEELEYNRLRRERLMPRATAMPLQSNLINTKGNSYTKVNVYNMDTTTADEVNSISTNNEHKLSWLDGDDNDHFSTVANEEAEEQEITIDLWVHKMAEYNELCNVANECATALTKENYYGNNDTYDSNKKSYENVEMVNTQRENKHTLFLTETMLPSEHVSHNQSSDAKTEENRCTEHNMQMVEKSIECEIQTLQQNNTSVAKRLSRNVSDRTASNEEPIISSSIIFCPVCNACCAIAVDVTKNNSVIRDINNNNITTICTDAKRKEMCYNCGHSLLNTKETTKHKDQSILTTQTNSASTESIQTETVPKNNMQRSNICEK